MMRKVFKDIVRTVFEIDFDRFQSLYGDNNDVLSLCKDSEEMPYPLHFITICWDIILGYWDEWKEEYKSTLMKRKDENEKFKSLFIGHGLDMTEIPFSDYWECFYCDEPDATIENCLDMTEDELKKMGFRDIDIELACCVNKFQFDKVKQLLEQGADPLKDWAEDDDEHITCVTRIYSEIQFIYSFFEDKVLGKVKLDDCEKDLYDLFCLAAHEKMDHLLDKYY
jgi:hypothetical protein